MHFGSGNTLSKFSRSSFPVLQPDGSFQLIFTRPSSIVSGQPGDKAALQDSIMIPWNATADQIKTAIMASSKFYKYDQNNTYSPPGRPNSALCLIVVAGWALPETKVFAANRS